MCFPLVFVLVVQLCLACFVPLASFRFVSLVSVLAWFGLVRFRSTFRLVRFGSTPSLVWFCLVWYDFFAPLVWFGLVRFHFLFGLLPYVLVPVCLSFLFISCRFVSFVLFCFVLLCYCSSSKGKGRVRFSRRHSGVRIQLRRGRRQEANGVHEAAHEAHHGAFLWRLPAQQVFARY